MNEYDELVSEYMKDPIQAGMAKRGQPAVAAEDDPYESVVADMRQAGEARERVAMNAGRLITPEKAARVLDHAETSGLPLDVAERNTDALDQDKRRKDSDFDVFKSTAPATSAWATENQYRAGLSMDDLRQLAKIEESIEGYGFWMSMTKSLFQVGFPRMASMALRAPGGFAEAFSAPANLDAQIPTKNKGKRIGLAALFGPTPFAIPMGLRAAAAKLTGNPESTITVPQAMLENRATKALDEFAGRKATEMWEFQEGWGASFNYAKKTGDYGHVVRKMLMEGMASAPNTALALVGYVLGGPAGMAMTTGGIGAGVAGETALEARKKGLDPVAGQTAALGKGVSAFGTEFLGTLLPMPAWVETVAKKYGRTVAERTLRTMVNFIGATGTSSVSEMGEEWGDKLVTEVVDKATGLNPNAFGPGYLAELAGAGGAGFFGGAVSGPAFQLPAAITMQVQAARTQRTVDFYTALGEAAGESKTIKLLPAAARQLVSKIIESNGGALKDVYISPIALEAHFQSAKNEMVPFLAELDILKEYEQSKENGTDLKIPLGKWIEKVVPTDHYKGLANDVKFAAGEMSANEFKDFQKRMTVEAESARAKEDLSVQKVYQDVRRQLEEEADRPPRVADAEAQVAAEHARVWGRIFGEDAYALFKKGVLQITSAPLDMPAASVDVDTAAEFDSFFAPEKTANDEESKLQETARAYGRTFAKGIMDAYAQKYGNEVNTDHFREWLSPVGYTGDNTNAFHATASAIQKMYQKRLLEKARADGKEKIFVMAGGPGSGKSSTAAGPIEGKSSYAMILDGVFGNYKKASAQIREWLDSGFRPTVTYVYRDPQDAWVNGVLKKIPRGKKARVIPAGVHAELHRQARETAIKLHEEFGAIVTFIDNSRGYGNHVPVSVDEIKKKGYADRKETLDAIVQATVRAAEEGQLHPSVAEGALQGAAERQGVLPGVPGEPKAGGGQSEAEFAVEQQEKVERYAVPGTKEYLEQAGSLSQPAVAEREGGRVLFEVAPDPNNAELTGRWNALSPESRQAISREVATKIIPRVLKNIGIDGEVTSQLGGYLDATNESFALVLPPGTDAAKIDSAIRQTGFVLRQDSVMAIGETEFPGSLPMWSIDFVLPAGDYKTVSEFYALLRSVRVGETQPVQGHTTVGNKMSVIYDEASAAPVQEVVEAIQAKLGEGIEFEYGKVNVAFVGKGDDQYGLQTASRGDTAAGGAPVQGNAADLQREASELLEEGIRGAKTGEAESGRSEAVTSFNQSAVPPGPESPTVFYSQLQKTIQDKMPNAAPVAMVRESVAKGQPLFQAAPGGEPRGRIRFGMGAINIDVFRNADRTTIIHEYSHLWLREMGTGYRFLKSKSLDSLTAAQQQFLKDAETTLNYLGAESFDAITTEQNEKWARSGEAYFMEGRAPSEELKGAFARFRAWFMNVYRHIKNLGVELNDDVRGVFDRLLAAQDAVNQARAEHDVVPLFENAKEVGMSDAHAARYAKAIEEAELAAEDIVANKVMAEMRREETRAFKVRRAAIEKEVAAEIDQRKEYIALSVLQRGKLPNGDPLPETMVPIKLSMEAIKEFYGEGHLDLLPEPYVYSRTGGVHPDEAAGIFGFRSGKELLDALETTTPRDEAIKNLTDERVKREMGTEMDEGKLIAEAMKAVHNDRRAQVLKEEMDHLVSKEFATFKSIVRRVTRPVPSVEAVRRQAEEIVRLKSIRDLQGTSGLVMQYKRAESRASRDAVELMLKGDVQGAFDAKLKERMNHELYKAAEAAREGIGDIAEYLLGFQGDDVRAKIGKAGGDYLDQIDALLERYEFKRGVSIAELDRRRSLLAWRDEQVAQGYDVAIPERLLNEARRVSYKEVPYEELADLRATVENIAHLAVLKNSLLANQKARTLDEARESIVASLLANHKAKDTAPDLNDQINSKIGDKVGEFIASHRKIEFIAEQMDGKPLGPAYDHFVKPLLEASARREEYRANYIPRIKKIFDVYSREERALWYYKQVDIPEIRQSVLKPVMLAIALNQGNPYNQEALLRGLRGLGGQYADWTQNHIAAVLNNLDERDVKVVNEVWALINSLWPDVSALERRVHGLAPEKVQGVPMAIRAGQLDGGYYPIRFNEHLSARQERLQEVADVKDLFGGQWARAMTRQGHAKARTNTGGKALRLDLGVFTEHIDDVVHDLTHREAVIDVWKIINDDAVRDTLERTLGKNTYKQFKPWLRAVAGERVSGSVRVLDPLFRRLRTGATVVNLGYKAASALVQTLGYTLTVNKIGPKYSAIGVQKLFSNGPNIKKVFDEIAEVSPEMRDRMKNYDRDVRDALSRLNIVSTKKGALSAMEFYTSGAYESFFYAVGLMDLATSIPTWLGAYQKALDGKVKGVGVADHARAVDYADKIVRTTQSAGRVMDLAAIQRGDELFKLFTMFYSQMSIQFNTFYNEFADLARTKNVAKFAGFVLVAWFGQQILEGLLRGRGPDDDEDWWKWALANSVSFPLETMVFVRDIVGGMKRYKYGATPALQAFENLSRIGKSATKMVQGEKEEVTRGDIRAIVDTVGYFAALPTRQLWQTAEYFTDWYTGEEEPANPFEGLWRALVIGKNRGDK